MAKKYFNFDNMALIVKRGEGDEEKDYAYGFLGKKALYENLGTIVGVREWDVDEDGPFVPYMIEQLTANGIAQNYRISGGGKSALILVADDVSAAALQGDNGLIGENATIGGSVITIESVSQVQKASISV